MLNKRRVLLLLNAYDQPTHQAAVEAARKFNWHLDANLLTPTGMINRWRGDGILSSLTDNPRTAGFVLQHPEIPCVDLSSWRNDIQRPRVAADNTAIGRIAARHFLSYDHRHFAWYASTPTPFGEARLTAFSAELQKSGKTVIRLDGTGSLNYSTMAGRLQNLPRPCAIFTANDADAAWISALCLEAGFQVPLDFSILGVDNNPLVCEVQAVPISSIDRDTAGMVQQGAALLQAAMDGRPIVPETVFIQPKGVITRASSDAFVMADELIRRAILYLQQNLPAKIGTPEVAAELGISRSLLNRRFRESTQTTLHQTLMKMRLNKAAELLLYTNWTIERIAAETGFTHASHLSNSFRKHFGQSPQTYRKSR
ncbi:helix-turn-helix domain-containing protein [Pontiella agarivorans]|uniref:Helix-turn-helix domain-containing protein n=1 Tax=Pontiella agarivorans TaxID=3038953 RepID=A0ABU5N259_9BACT|nr:helix-turn-helix domain-containing protein [Pontiella agarivorans]MDZ8120514.1 helix-turn-helix domain-containing protein [Pontiella agarivorans]